MSAGSTERIAELERQVAELTAQLGQAREATSERLRALADALPVMISYVEADERFRFANRAYEEWFERPLDQIIGRRLSDILPPDIYAHRAPFVRRALAGEKVSYEVTHQHSGGPRQAVIHQIPHFDRGEVRGFYALVQDITDRFRALAATQESEARFRRIADSAPVPIWVTGADRQREFVNVAYADFIGLSPAEARNADWRSILHPDDRAGVIAQSLAGEASGGRFTLEGRFRRADGEWRWLRSISQPRFDQAGLPEGFIGVAEDITDARRAAEVAQSQAEALEERADRRTRERDRLWTLSQDGIMICDMAGTWRSASPAWTRMLGWSIEHLIGNNAWALIHPDDREATRAAWERLARGETVRGFANRLRATDGTFRWFTWNAVPEGDDVYCIARDVTEARRQEDALHDTEDALRQAQKVEALGQLTGGVAHDFNNLLTPILGTLDFLVRKRDGDPRLTRLLEGALQSATRAKTLVQRLLAFARRQPLDLQPVELGVLVSGLEQLLRSTLGPTISLQLGIPNNLPLILADQHQVEMALLNLVVNARDAMPEGGTLTIGIAPVTYTEREGDLSPGRYVSLSVGDTGAGMDEETRRRAIEPFFSTKGPGGGTGLGLSMVHGLAGQLGGTLRIASSRGNGTTVTLLLPETALAAAAPANESAMPGSPAKLRVLLVDDEPLVRSSTAAMLEELHHQVMAFASGEEALAAVEQGLAPDILVTDQIMPHMSGSELIDAMRRRKPDIPALIVSGYRGRGHGDNGAHFLAKPFTLFQLARALEQVEGPDATADQLAN